MYNFKHNILQQAPFSFSKTALRNFKKETFYIWAECHDILMLKEFQCQ